MANNFQSIHNGNTWGSNNLFFNDRIIEKTRSRREHAKEIFGIYNRWSAGESEVNQLSTDSLIDVDYVYDTSFQKDIPQVFPILDEKNDEPNIEQMALIHLKSYPKAYEKYDKIIKFKAQADKDRKNIDDFIKNGIKSNLGIDNNNQEKLEELLRFYYDIIYEYKRFQQGQEYRKDDFLSTYHLTIKKLNNPSTEKNEQMRQHLSSIYPDINKKLDKINDKIPEFNVLISDFRKSLEHVRAKWVLGLKGKCPIEDELNPWYRFKLWIKKVCHVP